MKIIAGIEKDYQGEVVFSPGYSVGYLEQDPKLESGKTVKEIVPEGVQDIVDALKEFEEVNQKFGDPEVLENPDKLNALINRQAELQDKIDATDAWNLDSRLERAMDALRCPPEDQVVDTLSGGERRRLNLLRVLMEAPNVLILDEPTNDLDTQTLAILEDYLDSYEGIVIVVSHDRYFLDRVVRRIFAFEGNGEIRQYEGGYTDYVNRLAEEGRKPGETAEVQGMTARGVSEAESAQEAGGVTGTSGQDAAEQADSRNTWKREKKLKFSYKEQREYETIEDDIANLEAKVEQLDADMAENATNSVKLGELLAEKEAAEQALEEKMERWEYLEELAAKIAGQE
mgnify:CR=1 FL=1